MAIQLKYVFIIKYIVHILRASGSVKVEIIGTTLYEDCYQQ